MTKMRSIASALLLILTVLSPAAAIASAGAPLHPPFVEVDGSFLTSPTPKMHADGHIYVSLAAFTQLTGATASWDGRTLSVDGKPVDLTGYDPVTTGSDGSVQVPVRALAEALGYTVAWSPITQAAVIWTKGRPAGLPEDAVQVSLAVPNMGEHWARLQDLPMGPIYGVYRDKLVFLEYMPSMEAMEKGQSWTNLPGPPEGYHVDHINIDAEPHGHEGYPVPHYDIHFYFISKQEQSQITGPDAH